MKAGLPWCGTVVLVFLMVATPLIVAFKPANKTPASVSLPVPVVFTSRNHLDTLDGKNVGPPVEILGREKAVGGTLMVLYPDGRLHDLTGGKLYDVSRPTVSFDGTKIVFSAVRNSKDQWHIYEINLDGTGLRQLSRDDRQIGVLADPNIPKEYRNVFSRYGDFSPSYLPDGRIIFASTRYPSLSASCGQRALNLYVMNSDGSGMHRITTERAGAIDPYVMANGRVIFSHWVDNMNAPALAGSGLRPLEVEKNFASSFWILWSARPDGTEAGRYAFNGGKFADKDGIFQAREMPDGRIVYTYRAQGSLLGSTLASGIALLTPGRGDGNTVLGIGDPSKLEAPHALSPTPLPDSRILFSYTPSAQVETDRRGRTTSQFNYGLYIVNDQFGELSLVYDNPDRDELDAVAVYPRTAQTLADIPKATQITDDPTVDLGTTVILHNSNIYADLPLEFREILSPTPGSVVAVDFYDDSQTFTTSQWFPLLRKQMPRYLGSVPVNPDGSFTATVPADRPFFWSLRTNTGPVARTVSSPPVATQTSFVPTHDYFRPDQEVQCVGCHRGHMINPRLTFTEAKTNLARLARASASSSLDSYNLAPWRVNDSRLSDKEGRYDWASAGEWAPWVELSWLIPVVVDEVLLYPRSYGGNRVDEATLYLSDGTAIAIITPLEGEAPLKVPLGGKEIFWLRFQVEKSHGPSPGLAEIVVHGGREIALPQLPPQAPKSIKATEGSILLTWARNSEPFLGGYKVYYGTSSGEYTKALDVGNVDRFLMTGLEDGITYYMTVKAYSISGKESPASSGEVKATFHAPRLEGLSQPAGPTSGGTLVDIRGKNLTLGSIVLFGGDHARISSITPDTIQVSTPPHKAGLVDVVVIRPDGAWAGIPSAFSYFTPP